MERLEEERLEVKQTLKCLGNAYVDGLYGDEDYTRKKPFLEERVAIPGIAVAMRQRSCWRTCRIFGGKPT